MNAGPSRGQKILAFKAGPLQRSKDLTGSEHSRLGPSRSQNILLGLDFEGWPMLSHAKAWALCFHQVMVRAFFAVVMFCGSLPPSSSQDVEKQGPGDGEGWAVVESASLPSQSLIRTLSNMSGCSGSYWE